MCITIKLTITFFSSLRSPPTIISQWITASDNWSRWPCVAATVPTRSYSLSTSTDQLRITELSINLIKKQICALYIFVNQIKCQKNSNSKTTTPNKRTIKSISSQAPLICFFSCSFWISWSDILNSNIW